MIVYANHDRPNKPNKMKLNLLRFRPVLFRCTMMKLFLDLKEVIDVLKNFEPIEMATIMTT